MPAARQIRFAICCTLTVAFVWGVIWYPFRFLREAGIPPQLSSFLVYTLITALGCVLFRVELKRYWRLTPHLVLLILFNGWTNFGYTKAMTDGVVMRALLLFYLTPLWTALLGWLLLKEKLTRVGWRVVGASLAGCVAILWDPQAMLAGSWLSQPYEWMALSAGVSFALSQTFSRKAQSLPPSVKSSAIWLGTAGMGLVTSIQHGDLARIGGIDAWHWLMLLVLALVLISTSVLSQVGIAVLPANQSMTLMLSELVIAAVSAYFLAGESMQAHEWIGGLLIVGSSLFSGKMVAESKAAPALAPAGSPPQPEQVRGVSPQLLRSAKAEPAPPPSASPVQPLIRRRNIEGEATRPRESRRRR